MNTYEMKVDLERLLGFDCRPGCRVDLVEESIDHWGLSLSDIISAMSDSEVIQAVHYAMECNGVLAFVEDRHDDEECELSEQDDRWQACLDAEAEDRSGNHLPEYDV